MADNGLELTIVEVVRDAWPVLWDMNIFNSPPGEGEEYLLIKVRVRRPQSGNEKPIEVLPFDFVVVDETGHEYKHPLDVIVAEPLERLIQNQETGQWNLVFRIAQGRTHLLLRYHPRPQGEPKWFSLTR